jgi:hypothetical protein
MRPSRFSAPTAPSARRNRPAGNWRHQHGRAPLHLWLPEAEAASRPVCGARIALAGTLAASELEPYRSPHACYDCLSGGLSYLLARPQP